MNPVDDHRDPEVDATWRAASRDQPPPALDAAITAAARRAIGAGPKRLHAPRAWWPVAAAAVVAVVAIGIVEMTPPGEIAPTVMTPEPPQAPASRKSATRQNSIEAGQSATPAVPERAPSLPAEAKRKVERVSPPVDRFTAAPAVPQARQEEAASGANAQPAPAPPVQDAPESAAPRAAGALSPRSEPAPSNAPAALAKRAADSTATLGEAQARTADEWIRLIRRLKAEGRNDLATKELAAFRARYQERADALLPADLRDAKP